jgi:phosphohistidine swiveling domain-containing protein
MASQTFAPPLCDWDDPPNPTLNTWTTVNAAEVVPGVWHPLLSGWYQARQRRLFAAMFRRLGIPDSQIPIYPAPTPNFLASWAGQLALNVSFTTAIVSSYQTGAGSNAVEQLFTADEEGGHHAEAATDPEAAKKVRTRLFRILGQGSRMAAGDRKRAVTLVTEVDEADLPSLSDAKLRRLQVKVDRLMEDLFENHIMLSVLASGEYVSMLEQFLSAAIDDLDDDATVRLTSGLGNVESARPMESLWAQSRAIIADTDLTSAFAGLSTVEIKERFEAPPDAAWQQAADGFGVFLRDFGYRSQSEWDLGVPRWREEPLFPLNALRNMVGAGSAQAPSDAAGRAEAARREAESHYRALLPASKRSGYDRLLLKAQQFVRIREFTKATVIMAIGRGRDTMLAQGARFVERGWLRDPDDVFFLLYDEFEQGVAGHLDPAETLPAIVRRRRQFEDVAGYRLPDNFEGLPEIRRIEAAPEPTATLKGLGVSPGVVTGPARVIPTFSEGAMVDFKPGEILVAPYTDAPWTPLFATAAAVVVETGGVLSHAATVAREYGIPAVAMIKDATRMIKNGQTITVHGGAGQVTLG